MGKKAKAHRAKVAKRNRVIAQQKYTVQNSFNKLMREIAEKQEAEKLNVMVGDKEVPFEVVAEPTSTGIKGFEVQ
jgi:hypothetical protein